MTFTPDVYLKYWEREFFSEHVSLASQTFQIPHIYEMKEDFSKLICKVDTKQNWSHMHPWQDS